jgi:uncharacterized DUF497 family protein
MIVLREPVTFVWDKANRQKNLEKHGVTIQEIEEVFFDPHKKLLDDRLHSGKEGRYILLGQTKGQRLLFVAFTIRRNEVRAISARDLNKRERPLYEETPETSKI